MNKLVVHHFYVNGLAFDTSNNRNHGVPISVTAAAPPLAPSFSFASPNSQIIVQPSESLQNLIAIRAIVTFYLAPPQGIVRRFNLIEGHLSFALFVNPDGSLAGTIRDSAGNWVGATSAPNLVPVGEWHQAELRHDGVNQCVLLLDGKTVAMSYTAKGPVGSVGPHGIAIGHWPEVPGVYTFEGHMRETLVYKYDPVQAAKALLDTCCADRAALDRTADRLRAHGYTASQAREQGMAIMNLALSVTAEVRGSDQIVSQQQSNISDLALAAFLRGDSVSYTKSLAHIGALAKQRLTLAQLHNIQKQVDMIVAGLPLSLQEWQQLITDLCLDRARFDAALFKDEFDRLDESGSHSRKS